MVDRPSLWELLQQGKLPRRRFIKTCVALTGLLGLSPAILPAVVARAETRPGGVNAQTWTFAMISDTHDSDMVRTRTGVTAHLAPIVNYIVDEHPDFVIQTGDLITGAQTLMTSPVFRKYDMQYAYYKQVTAPFSRANIPLFVIRGNHDYGLHNEDPALNKAYMADIARTMPQNGPPAAKGLSYSFVHNKIKFIMVDQYVNAANGIVTLPMEWIKDELASRQGAEHIFVMGHSPAFTPDTTASSKIAQFNLFDQTNLRDQFWKLLTDNQVTAYISGHEHLYFRGRANGLPQIVIGNLGSDANYNPATVDSRLTNVFPTTPVPNTQGRPGYSIFTVDDGQKSLTATEYWLDQNNNKYVYDTYALIP
ncbi:MAG: metallophosphoesterase [Sporomusaceae bacterium]|nr:metallophosphoesterase [Sporomusaceae bacterium]